MKNMNKKVMIMFLALIPFGILGCQRDNIDLPFVNDSAVLGTWISVDFVKEPSLFTVGEKSSRRELYLKELTFLPDGKTTKSFWTWTKGVLMHSGDKTAGAYEIKEINKDKYMFLEWKSGTYIILRQKPKYYVLKKAKLEQRGLSKIKFTNSEKLKHKQRYEKYLKKQLIKVQALVKVAEQGTAMEQEQLAYMYLTGKGAQHDYTEAFKWYKKAAEQGHSESQNMVGSLYTTGLGVTLNYKEAIKWHKKSAEQGNLKAYHKLGGIYYFGKPAVGEHCSGPNCFQDYKEGLKWYKKAANQGYAEAHPTSATLQKTHFLHWGELEIWVPRK